MIVSFEFSLFLIFYWFSKYLHYLCFWVKESIADIPADPPCLGDLADPSQFQVQGCSEILMIVLMYGFHNFSPSSRSGNSLLSFLKISYGPRFCGLQNPGHISVHNLIQRMNYTQNSFSVSCKGYYSIDRNSTIRRYSKRTCEKKK